MNSIIFCLTLIFKIIICENLERDSKEGKYGGPWPQKPQPLPYPVPEAPYPAPEIPYPPQQLEPGNWKPSSDGGVLGLNKMFRDGFPTPGITPIGITNVTYFDKSTCSPKSIVQNLLFDETFTFPFTCNGVQSYIVPWTYNITIDGQSAPLSIPNLYLNFVFLNGNMINVATGVIDSPKQCVGGYYWKIVVYVANSQYQCVTTGVNGHTMIYSLKLITGNCQSTCWLVKGYTKQMPPVNNKGSLLDPANNS